MNRLKINKMKNNRICIYKLKEIIMKNNRTRIDKLGESRMNIDRLKQNIIKLAGIILVMAAVSGIAGCGKSTASTEKVFYYGDTTFNAENDETDVNPHNGYSGWACIRYGVGETLFKYSDTMELEPWLAESYENVDELTWKINLKDGITFTSGRKLDGEAVKECIEHLVAVHKRAAGDLNIERVEAEADTVIITTAKPVPALINYLSDPYGCIIDMQAGITDEGNVSATGPYIAEEIVTDSGLTLVKNQNYWNGEPRLDKIIVKTISDGDTLTMALQSDELNAAYGLPYSSLSLFNNSNYTISSSETSRSFFAQMNYANVNLQDSNVRAAIAMAINKKDFTNVLLKGNGTLAEGPFPKDYTFGDSYVKAAEYNIDNARHLLAQSGWKDTDGDGYVEKNGEKLTLRWLTYPSRQELPLLAENVQASLKQIGIDVKINCTANHLDYVKKGEWDIYASAFVCAPTGDPEYFFTTHCLKNSSKNRGGYYNEQLEQLEEQLSTTFDTEGREQLGIKMTQTILDDNAFIFASHLKMSIVSGKGVSGLTAHPSDYYEITAELDMQ
ncbi:putative oligopeptide ABC transporter solute-binding protein [Eubacterium sp. CAG:76]|nr:putative oligopeptide ABC transporter solute-binding protein [Eubacterium sp. CAG:76]